MLKEVTTYLTDFPLHTCFVVIAKQTDKETNAGSSSDLTLLPKMLLIPPNTTTVPKPVEG